MVKRTPPLSLAVVGTGETSAKNVEALLNDYTAPYAEVTLVLPVDEDHWSPTMDAVFQWGAANDIPFVAVTNGSTPSKKMSPILDAADKTIKVARVSTKLVQLLQDESGEGAQVALLVAWDDDDEEAVLAVNKALSAQVTALNLCDGLDEFSFDDEEEGQDDSVDHEALDAKHAQSQSEDDYEDKGIRALRALLRERADEHDIPDRTIGQLEKADAVRALRNIDAGKGKHVPAPAEEPEEDDEDTGPAVLDRSRDKETRTTRARRAFAEGAAEGSGDEAQSLPRSKGSDILENEGDDDEAEETTVGGPTANPNIDNTETDEVGLRHRALELAISGGKSGAEAIADAIKYATYLKGERNLGGRPRADGSPAQPREIGEDGKPIRRRRTTSSTD